LPLPRPLPNCSKVFRDACERSGLSELEIMKRLGYERDVDYMDLEWDDHELYFHVDLNNIAELASMLSISPLELLAIEVPDYQKQEKISFDDITNLIKKKLSDTGESVEDFENRVGWSLIAPVLEDSSEIGRRFNVDALCDVCDDLGIHWWKAIPQK
jgi:hypothetical protein